MALTNTQQSSVLTQKTQSVCSKRDISPSEGHFGVKTKMAAILNGRSKPKRSKQVTSKDHSE